MKPFDVLRTIQRKKSGSLFENSSPEELKDIEKFIAYPALRYMSASDDDLEHELLLLLCARVNLNYGEHWKDHRFQAKLLETIDTGSSVRYKWIKPPSSKAYKKLYDMVRQVFIHASDECCAMFLGKMSDDHFKQFTNSLSPSRTKSESVSTLKAFREWKKSSANPLYKAGN